MNTDNYVDGVLRQRWSDETRLYTEYDESGNQTSQRPYNDEENAIADARVNSAAVATAQANFERALALNAEAELVALQEAMLAAEGIKPGDEWRQPTGAHDAYPLGAVVAHNGKNWESTVAANVWEPGVSGWKEDAAIPEWVQPTGAHDAYNTGDVVSFEDAIYRSLIDDNVWSPTANPAGWEEVV